jgi:hypothetical protein
MEAATLNDNTAASISELKSIFYLTVGARSCAVGWGTALEAGRLRVRFHIFSLKSSFRLYYGPGIDSTSNRNKYQRCLLGVKAASV